MSVKIITSLLQYKNFRMLNLQKPAIVALSKENCKYCHLLKPSFKAAASKLPHISFVEIPFIKGQTDQLHKKYNQLKTVPSIFKLIPGSPNYLLQYNGDRTEQNLIRFAIQNEPTYLFKKLEN